MENQRLFLQPGPERPMTFLPFFLGFLIAFLDKAGLSGCLEGGADVVFLVGERRQQAYSDKWRSR